MNLKAQLAKRLNDAFRAAGAGDAPIRLSYAKNRAFGDYQANGAMAAGKQTGKAPRELAARIVESLDGGNLIDSAEVAGPGFINLTLSDTFLANAVSHTPLTTASAPLQRVVVDYSSPNLAKEMHVGHLRSTIIGDSVARVLEALGHDVVRQNHVGDWGTQFGMLVTEFADRDVDRAALADLETFYRDAKVRFDADPEFAERSRQAVVRLQSGDPETLARWQQFIDTSLAHCDDVYRLLGTSLRPEHVQAESAYNDALADIVTQLDDAGLITVSDGAKCVFLDEFANKDGEVTPVIVQKSDGGYLYATTDLAALRYRTHNLRADRILYFTDARQALHFRQIFAVGRRAGLVPNDVELEHMPFGSMLDASGRPFKTRAGSVVKLSDLLIEAVDRADALVSAKNPALDSEERAAVARAVGIGAIKYADLSKNRTSDYQFNWDQMLSFDGNTAPYLQYAYTRIRSVFARAEVESDAVDAAVKLDHEAERRLALLTLQYQEILEQVAEDGTPHVLCTHLFDLATAFMHFYEACPILKSTPAVRDSRLRLCERTARTLHHGLNLLGIDTVERM